MSRVKFRTHYFDHRSTTYGSVFEWFSTHTRDWPMSTV